MLSQLGNTCQKNFHSEVLQPPIFIWSDLNLTMAKLKIYFVLDILCPLFGVFLFLCFILFYFWPMGSRRWAGTPAPGSLLPTSFIEEGKGQRSEIIPTKEDCGYILFYLESLYFFCTCKRNNIFCCFLWWLPLCDLETENFPYLNRVLTPWGQGMPVLGEREQVEGFNAL